MMTPAYTIENLSLRKEVVKALRLAIDPELGINIVDMGLIYAVNTDDNSRDMEVIMTLSSRGCPMGAAISGSAENVLGSRFPGYSIRVDLSWEPAWSYEFISERGLQELEL